MLFSYLFVVVCPGKVGLTIAQNMEM